MQVVRPLLVHAVRADASGRTAVLTHVMPFHAYGHEWTCGPDRRVCCEFDFMRVDDGPWSCDFGRAPRINESNVAERCDFRRTYDVLYCE